MYPDRPWMTALEMQFTAARIARMLDDDPTRADSVSLRVNQAAARLPTSTCFAWTAEPTAAAWQASASVPDDAVFSADLLPEGAHSCWWWFDAPLPVPLAGGASADYPESNEIVALLCGYGTTQGQQQLIVVDFRMARWGPVIVPLVWGLFAVPVGATLGTLERGRMMTALDRSESGPPSARCVRLGRFLLAASAWLRQRVVVLSEGHIERHRRKQIAREYAVPPPAAVQVVQLRRPEAAASGLTAGTSVDWSCRWVVHGHWRNQPYKDTRRLIYIMPFVKGPADKPLRVPSHTVYQVSR